MNRQAEPGAQQPTVSYGTPPGEPPLVPEPLPLKDRVTLYFGHHKINFIQVRHLVYLITKRANGGQAGYQYCRDDEQQEILAVAMKNSVGKWQWNAKNLGQYIASGLTQPSDLFLAMVPTEEDIKQIPNGPETFTPERLAQMKESEIFKAAEKRLFANRLAYPQKAEVEDQNRKAKQAMKVPALLTMAEKSNHALLAGAAARQIQEKK